MALIDDFISDPEFGAEDAILRRTATSFNETMHTYTHAPGADQTIRVIAQPMDDQFSADREVEGIRPTGSICFFVSPDVEISAGGDGNSPRSSDLIIYRGVEYIVQEVPLWPGAYQRVVCDANDRSS